MKRLMCWIALIFFSRSLVFSQELSSGKVTYHFNLNLKGISLPRTAQLYFIQDRVLFFHSRGNGFVMVDKFGNTGDHTLSVTTVNDNSGQAPIDGYYQDGIGNTYFFDYDKKKLISREIIFLDSYLYEESIPTINWEITMDQRLIDRFVCFKAIGHFRGRNYTAWFCPDIAVPYGPWKLHGLPGLILEVEDEKKEVSFKVSSLKFPIERADAEIVIEPRDGKKISFEEAKTIWSDVQKKLVTRMNSTQERDSEAMGIKKLNLMEIFDENK